MDGPPYPVVLRLYAVAAARWAEVESAYYQVDLLTTGPRKFCNLIYAWCVQWMDAEKREQWDYELSAPLPGADPHRVSEQQVEQEAADFMATLAMHQGMTGG
jgi:hypothetical protein